MKNYFYNLRDWIKNNKMKSGSMLIAFGFLFFICLYFLYVNQESLIMKEESFIVEVNEELSQDATVYFEGIKDVNEVTFDFADVDYKKLGKYEGKLFYRDKEYLIKFDVVDKKAPVINIKKSSFTFSLNTTKEEVNEAINAEIEISDNYDNEFAPLEVVTQIPSDGEEITKNISIKDTSGNQSNEISITLVFQREEIESEDVAIENEPSSDKNAHNSNTSQEKSQAVTPTPKPQPKPTPTPEPAPTPQPQPEPEAPTYTTPTGCLDGGWFNNYEEGDAWGMSLADDSNSPYYGWMICGDSFENGKWHFYLQPM